MLMDSMGQESGKGTGKMACLCSLMPGTSAGRLKGWVLESSDSHLNHVLWLMLNIGWDLS